MYATVRRYTNSAALIDAIGKKSAEVQKIISAVPGFVAYYATRDGDTMTSVTVCNDRQGTDQSTKEAAAWVKENVKTTGMGAPEVSSGEVFLSFSAERMPFMKSMKK